MKKQILMIAVAMSALTITANAQEKKAEPKATKETTVATQKTKTTTVAKKDTKAAAPKTEQSAATKKVAK